MLVPAPLFPVNLGAGGAAAAESFAEMLLNMELPVSVPSTEDNPPPLFWVGGATTGGGGAAPKDVLADGAIFRELFVLELDALVKEGFELEGGAELAAEDSFMLMAAELLPKDEALALEEGAEDEFVEPLAGEAEVDDDFATGTACFELVEGA
jgi:hypothetical protein